MSVSITRIAVLQQIAAMGCEAFDVGVLRQNGRMVLREGRNTGQIDAALNWLRRENARGAHIYIRPSGAHALSLLDDLSADSLRRMKKSGFAPALVVETSSNNFQVWLNHGRILDCALSTRAAKELARRFGGDPSSADWRHFGRLAGFTNQKPERRLENGLAPFVRLHECQGQIYSVAPDFVDAIRKLAARLRSKRKHRTLMPASLNPRSIRDLVTFHADPRYRGDLHRADMAWALHAARRGLSEGQIRDEILSVRDLAKKGGPARQVDYAERTAAKALASAHQPH